MNFVTVEEADFHRAMIESYNFHTHIMHQAFLHGEISEEAKRLAEFWPRLPVVQTSRRAMRPSRVNVSDVPFVAEPPHFE